MTKLHHWFIEFEKTSLIHHIQNVVVTANSPYQEIAVADTVGFGRAVFLDGVAQSSAMDEHIYHEALAHPALAAHPNPQRIFIAGGGEGALLRECLKHNSVTRILMVDLDEMMVDVARQHLQSWHQGAFEDERVQLVYRDARNELENSSQQFDVIMADLPDPLEDSPVASFYTHQFFDTVSHHLGKNGIFAIQAGVADYGDHHAYTTIINAAQHSFAHVMPYITAIPFFRSTWGFIIASNQSLSFNQIDQTLQQRGCTDLKFYDAETHRHMFSLPRYLRDSKAREILSEFGDRRKTRSDE